MCSIGDATVLTLPKSKPLAKAAVHAEAQAGIADRGIARRFAMTPASPFTGKGVCYVENGDHQPAHDEGNLLSAPAPSMTRYPPSRAFHDEKLAQERAWLYRGKQ